MLKNSGDKPDLLGGVHGEEGGGGAAEVVQRHGLPKPCVVCRQTSVIDRARA